MFIRNRYIAIVIGLCLFVFGYIIGHYWDNVGLRNTGHPFPDPTEKYEAIDPNNNMISVQVESTVWSDGKVTCESIVFRSLDGNIWKIIPYRDADPCDWLVYYGQSNDNMILLPLLKVANSTK